VEEAGVTIVSHTYKEHAAAGQAALQTAADALKVYGELFSIYPRPYFAIVEAEFADGLEYDGLIFVSRNYHAEYSGTPQDFLILLVAHEVAHQWWYGLVGNDQAGEPWLDEAFATYSEALFYERYYPDLVSWWWQFRVNYFRAEGWVNWRIYDTGRFTVYFHAVYLRGALFLRDLRALVGDDVFFDLLKNYNRGLAYRQATASDFFQYLTELTSGEAGPLVAAYFKAEK
jgi:aminopeptidase N